MKNLLLSMVIITAAITQTLGATFQSIGASHGQTLNDISADGQVIVADWSLSGQLWTSTDGFETISGIRSARAVSYDGTLIAGEGNIAGRYEACSWTFDTGVAGLGVLDGGGSSVAYGVSLDGSVIVGSSESSAGTEAFRWTTQGGMVSLGDLPGGEVYSYANAVSGDGSIVVGRAGALSAFSSQAFRWTAETGMVGLGDLTPGGFPPESASFHSSAYGISSNGEVIVGYSDSPAGGVEGFYWTESEGMVGLGYLPGAQRDGIAHAVSGDGSVIVGESAMRAFYWTENTGMLNLQNMLEDDYGLDLTGWSLWSVSGISDDGLTMIGNGSYRNLDDDLEFVNWVATIPEPTSLLLLGLGGIVLRRRRAF